MESVVASGSPMPDKNFMKIRIWSAVFMLLTGFGMSVAGFVVPPVGEISDSVLMYTAQAFVYAGTALGLDVIMDCKIKSIKEK